MSDEYRKSLTKVDILTKDESHFYDVGFNEGFDVAINLIHEVINSMDWLLAYTVRDVLELIENEVELYKKDG